MWSTWWTLPGPSAFVDELIASLRAGRNLVVALPRHAPPGLATAVGRRVHADELWRWREHSANEREIGPGGPAGFLIEQIFQTAPDPFESWPECLAETREMHDLVLWLDGINGDGWIRWKECLVAYARTCQSRPQLGRGLLCCILSGVAQKDLPSSDTALAVHTWAGRLDELDMQIWIAHLLRNLEITALERRVRRVLAAGLAGFDPVLALSLARLDLEILTKPLDLLVTLATERGWSQPDTQNPTWHSGMLDTVGGERQVHLALQALAAEDAMRCIDARIWEGQVTVIFPLIEQRRKQILSKYRRSLWVPFDKGDGTIVTAVEDLEINHLYYQLHNHTNPRIEPLLRRLKDARNALAHLDVLSGYDLAGLLRILSN